MFQGLFFPHFCSGVRKAISIILVVSVLFPALFRIGVLADFYRNSEYIARVLCVNKSKPVNTCHGTCHLMKQMAKADEGKTGKGLPALNEKSEITEAVVEEYQNWTFPPSGFRVFPTFRNNYFFLNSYDFFHPPKYKA